MLELETGYDIESNNKDVNINQPRNHVCFQPTDRHPLEDSTNDEELYSIQDNIQPINNHPVNNSTDKDSVSEEVRIFNEQEDEEYAAPIAREKIKWHKKNHQAYKELHIPEEYLSQVQD